MKALTTQPSAATGATNLIPAGNYSGASPGSYTLTGLVVGQAYSWVPGANDVSVVVNGSITITVASIFTATATSVALKGTTSAAITAIVSPTTLLYPATVTPALIARQITIGQFPAANPNWARQIQVSDEFVFVKRGLFGVAIALSDVVNLALSQEIGLTWTPPIALVQPVAATCNPTASATGTLTGSGSTNVSDGDTVTIETTVYRFKTVMAAVNDIQIGGSGNSDTSVTNLIDAINGTGTAGTNWFAGTVANTQVTAGALTSHAVTVTAIIPGLGANVIATTKSSAVLAWGAATLAGGTDAAATFTIQAGSEYALTYQWQYSVNGGSTWNNATGTVSGCAYTNGTTATLTCTPSTAGQTGALHRCLVTDDAGSFGATNGVLTSATAILTIP